MRVNLLLLTGVSFLPFPTRLMAEAIHNDSAERAAVIFYGISLFVVSLLVSALWATIRSDRRLIKPEVPEYEIESITPAAARLAAGANQWSRSRRCATGS